ncbi:hypothetical protein FACS18942_00890 [Planctomycetales bacterium]|nr:hypothetical protein FACS18942_00890 [Planctomycetales bacterium]
MKRAIILICTVLFFVQNLPVFAQDTIHLFNGKNLDGWYTFLSKRGKNDDPNKVFSVQDGLLKISGEEWGGITTNDEYENYSLEIEFKTGTKTYSHRIGKGFDSGLLIHAIGEDGAVGKSWMRSIQCCLIDGGCGDIAFTTLQGDEEKFSLTTTVTPPSKPQPKSGLDYDPDGIETTIHRGRINRIGRDHDWQDVTAFRGKDEIEKEHGQWNTIKCVAQGDTITIFLNGKLVNKAKSVKPQKGKIQLQSEGAEYFFKRIDLTPL